MLHDAFELPVVGSAAESGRPFVPRIPVKSLEPRGAGPGATYFAFLTGYDSSTFDLDGPRVLHGVRLPELCEHLRRTEPAAVIERRDESTRPKDPYAAKYWSATKVVTDWPRELLLFRASLADRSRDIGLALRACNDFPAYRFGGAIIGDAGLGPVDRAHETLEALRGRWRRSKDSAETSLFQASDHLAQMSMALDLMVPASHQWVLFDDVWAAAHPDLANGLLDWASRWDVLG
jgi:hypothetical protein